MALWTKKKLTRIFPAKLEKVPPFVLSSLHFNIRTFPYRIMKIETCGQTVLILFQVDLDDGPARMVVMSFLYRTIQKKKRRSSHRASCLVSGPLTPSYICYDYQKEINMNINDPFGRCCRQLVSFTATVSSGVVPETIIGQSSFKTLVIFLLQ